MQTISNIQPNGDFEILEENLMHFTIWRIFQKTSPNKINEALSLWRLQQELFRKYNPMRTGVIPITTEDILKIFKAAFIGNLDLSHIDNAFKLWHQRSKNLLPTPTLTERTDYISFLDMHAAFSSTLEKETDSDRIIYI